MQMMSKVSSATVVQRLRLMELWNKKWIMTPPTTTIDLHRHQWAHIRHRMRPRKINQIKSILTSHQHTTMPFRTVINNGKICYQLQYYYHDRVMQLPMNWAKCCNHRYHLVIYFHVLCAKHRLNLVCFDSILIDTIHVIARFVQCYSVVDVLLIRILCEIICGLNTPCNGPKWKQCDHRAAHLVV